MEEGFQITIEAQCDMMCIQDWDVEGRWYPSLRAAVEMIPTLPPGSYNCTPTSDIKYQPVHHLYDRGIPAYHIVWEERLNGFRPMILNLAETIGITVVTGIALERSNLDIPSLVPVTYDDDSDPQIKRMIDYYAALTKP